MKKYFDHFGKKVGSAHERLKNYWGRLMNHSKERKLSEGSQQINKIITSAHKDQWRRGDKK